jgi:hypothetical protein
MSVEVTSSARETFTPREITTAYKDFEKLGPQHLDAETGIKAAAYRFDERVLLVYEEAETGLVVLMHPSALKVHSLKAQCRISHNPAPTEPEAADVPTPNH